MPEQKSNVTKLASRIGSTFVALLGTGLGWIAYSKFAINHNRFLPPALSAERKAFNSAGAGRLSYYVDANHDGTPLVFIHSINAAASAYEMRPLFQYYRMTRPVYALDLPGFGFSERSDRQYTPDLYARAITDFLANEIGKPADVVALSLSCEFAARAALAQPEAFRSLVLISPSGFSARQQVQKHEHEPNDERLASNTVHDVLSVPLWSQPLYDLLTIRPSIRYYLQKSFVGPVDPGLQDYAYDTSHQPGARYAPLYFVSGSLFTHDILNAAYRKLTLPVLVLYDQDAYTSFEELPALVASTPNWHAERIVPSRGLPHFEKLDDTVRAINQHTPV